MSHRHKSQPREWDRVRLSQMGLNEWRTSVDDRIEALSRAPVALQLQLQNLREVVVATLAASRAVSDLVHALESASRTWPVAPETSSSTADSATGTTSLAAAVTEGRGPSFGRSEERSSPASDPSEFDRSAEDDP